jgi:hypothetical protein
MTFFNLSPLSIFQLILSIFAAKNVESKKAAATPECPKDWIEFEAHCYWFSGNEARLSWPNAERYCVLRGSHLASIHSKIEQDFILSISSMSNYTWLGGSDMFSEVCECFQHFFNTECAPKMS